MSSQMEHQIRKHKDAWELIESHSIYEQSFFGCFIYWGMFKNPPENQNIKNVKKCGLLALRFV